MKGLLSKLKKDPSLARDAKVRMTRRGPVNAGPMLSHASLGALSFVIRTFQHLLLLPLERGKLETAVMGCFDFSSHHSTFYLCPSEMVGGAKVERL